LKNPKVKIFAGTGEWTRVCNFQSCLWCIYSISNSIDANIISEIGFPRGGCPYPLRLHVKEAGAGAKLIQHGPLGVGYHCRPPISIVPVARITAHAMVPRWCSRFLAHSFCSRFVPRGVNKINTMSLRIMFFY